MGFLWGTQDSLDIMLAENDDEYVVRKSLGLLSC